MDDELQLLMLQEKLQSTSSLVDDDFTIDNKEVENFTNNSSFDTTASVEDSFNSDGKFCCSYASCKALFWSEPCEICKNDGLVDMCYCKDHHDHEVHRSISFENNSLLHPSENNTNKTDKNSASYVENNTSDHYSVYALLKAIPQVHYFF